MTKRNVLETVTVFAIAAFALTAFVPAASAQDKTFSFSGSVRFLCGAILMPAGKYTVSQTPFTRATQITIRRAMPRAFCLSWRTATSSETTAWYSTATEV